ncbi:MAG TPA: FkbM family methyltransferase [Ramlibacter sp.]|uniref:FkbM family methyltransferase n=1 Tax=Ramlibacter sp. TaxID=1917967 RepID=UPI002BBF32B7|nr:FkbM family methyltransferase [Ramlibacter sp.]HVZ42342.1 FkbM family methyltransferase [Ramlibacter sp.]
MLPRVNLVRTDDADYLLFSTNDVISRGIHESGAWEPHLLTIANAFVSGVERPLVFDIGANLGGFAVRAAKMIQQSGGSVWAFEPQRIVYYQLCGNIFLNRLDNVVAYNYAVGETDATLELPVPDYARLSNVGGYSVEAKWRELNGTQGFMTAATEAVRCVCLDNLAVPRRVNFIKLDVEGLELQVLRGAAKFLAAQGYPPIFFEVWDTPWFAEGKKALLDYVLGLGYEVTPLPQYDHVAQHPAHPVRIEFTKQSETSVNMRRVR